MKKVRIIHTNDIHSKFEEFLQISYKIKELKDDNSLLLDAGDFNDFSSLDTFGSDGYLGLKLLYNLNYKALTIGNNEGFQNIEIIKKYCEFNLVNILSCNITTIDDKELPFVKKSIIEEINGIKFLIIGVSPFAGTNNLYYNLHNLKAIKPYDIINNEIKNQKKNYDFVILLSHLGIKYDIFTSQICKDIDIIIGGHSHTDLNPVKVNNTIICQSGERASHVGYLDLYIEDKKIINFTGKNIKILAGMEKDKQQEAEYNLLKEKAILNINKPIFDIPCSLISKIDEESNFTNLLADYLYLKYPCDLAFISSGLTEKTLKKGSISIKDIMDASCGSPLQIATFEIKGKELKKAIRQSSNKEKCYEDYRRPGFRGKFLGKIHVSFNCLISDSLYIDNVICEDETYYKVVSTDYFLRGMGYTNLINNINGEMKNESLYQAIKTALNEKKFYKRINERRWKND